MKKLGGVPLPAEKGKLFDPKIHRVVNAVELGLPDGTILDVLRRGFQVDGKPYFAEVIVARNIRHRKADSSRCSACNSGSAILDCPQSASASEPRECKSDSEGSKCMSASEARTAQNTSAREARGRDWPIDGVYHDNVRKRLQPLLKNKDVVAWLKEYEQEVWSLFSLDMDKIRGQIMSLYSEDKRGHPPVDPFAILRSLLLMTLLKRTQITAWAKEVKSSTLLCILCGFPRGEAPAVGTYYELFKRLENGPYQRKCAHIVSASTMRHKRNPYRMPKGKPEDKPKRQPEEEGVLKKLADELKSQ